MLHTLPVLMVLALIACGFFARRRGMLSATGTTEMAQVLVAVIYPALIVTRIPRLTTGDLLTYWYLPVLVSAIALTGLVLGLIAMRWMGETPDETRRAFLFHCLMNNYLFLPLPIVQWLYGDRGVALLFFSSIGYEVLLWTLGVFMFAPGQSLRRRIRNVFSPPMIALLASIAWVVVRDGAGVRWPNAGFIGHAGGLFAIGAATIGNATVSVSMLVAGSRIAALHPRAMGDRRTWLVSAIRLVAVPALAIFALRALPIDPTARGVAVIVAAMPAAVASVIFAERFGGDGEFIAGGLVLTHLWAMVTVPVFLAIGLP